MKTLAFIFALFLTPILAQAEIRDHYNHQNHYNRHDNNRHFWKDVMHRQKRQDRRIERGLEEGLLTRREIKKLRREQRHVTKQIRHMRRHRYIGHRDQNDVMEHLDYLSKKIRKFKHNNRYAKRHYYDDHGHNRRGKKSYSHFEGKHHHRNDRYISRVNDNYSAGLYFRF